MNNAFTTNTQRGKNYTRKYSFGVCTAETTNSQGDIITKTTYLELKRTILRKISQNSLEQFHNFIQTIQV